MTKLIVWWEGRKVGTLVRAEGGKGQFQYDQTWLEDPRMPPLCIALPKVPDGFPIRKSMTFFNGLLPEGAIRKAVAKQVGVSESNTYGLLEGVGGDVAGAIQLLPEGVNRSIQPVEGQPALAEAVAASVTPVTAELAHLDQAFLRELGGKVVQRAQICVRSLPG